MRVSSLIIASLLLTSSSSLSSAPGASSDRDRPQSRRSPIVDLPEEIPDPAGDAIDLWLVARTDEDRRQARDLLARALGDRPERPVRLIDLATLEQQLGMTNDFDRTMDAIVRLTREERITPRQVRVYLERRRGEWQERIDGELPREYMPEDVAPAGYAAAVRAVADRLAGNQPALAMELYLYCGWLFSGTFDAAVASLESAVRVMPRSVRAYAELGAYLDQQHQRNRPYSPPGALAEAIAAYREAARLDPKDANALDALGHLLMRAGRPEEALSAMQRAAVLDADSDRAAWIDVMTYALAADRASPDFDGCLNERGLAALRACRATLKSPDALGAADRSRAYAMLGEHLLAARQPSEEIATVWRDAVARAPEADVASRTIPLIAHLIEGGRVAEAMPLLDRLIQSQPALAIAHALRGRALAKDRQDAEAADALATAVRLAPDDIEAAITLTQIQSRLERRDDAARTRDSVLARVRRGDRLCGALWGCPSSFAASTATPTIRASSSAIRAGLLLALRDEPSSSPFSDSGAGRASYRTLWIAPTAHGLDAISIDGLVVPRKDGWWRLIRRATPDPGDGTFDERFRFVPLARRREDGLQVAGPRTMDYVGWIEDVTFLGPDRIGVEAMRTSSSRGRENTVAWQSVLLHDELKAELPRERIEAMATSWSDSIDRLLQMTTTLPLEDVETPEHNLGFGWVLARNHGRWAVRAASRALAASAAPPAIVGYDELRPDWLDIRAAVPDAIDAFTSPTRDLAVLTTEHLFIVTTIADGRIGPPLLWLARATNEHPVMAEWATGAAVGRWTTRLAAVGKRLD
jgi:tetratricopeptide (TPR) repeat protein